MARWALVVNGEVRFFVAQGNTRHFYVRLYSFVHPVVCVPITQMQNLKLYTYHTGVRSGEFNKNTSKWRKQGRMNGS